jgi:hypothetical protein
VNLIEEVRRRYVHEAVKHDLCAKGESPEDYADRKINALTNAQLLDAISDALDTLGVTLP